MESHSDSASAHLSAVASARSAVADRLVTPWWYHPVLGLLLAGHLVAVSLSTIWVTLLSTLVVVSGALALARAYQRRTGLWLSGQDARTSTRWAYALGGLVLMSMVASLAVTWQTTLTWPVYLLAGVVMVGTVVLGRAFDRSVRANLRAQG